MGDAVVEPAVVGNLARRRYHTHGGPDRTLYPTDELGQQTLDGFHEVTLIIQDQRLHLAPIGESPQRILDVGTGTGIWAMDMAYEYPSAEVIGTDLSPIQPTMIPPNCRFEITDAEGEWSYDCDLFDFIYVRNLGDSISHWETLLSEAWRCLAPGGYIEVCEFGSIAESDDDTMRGHNGLRKFYDTCNEMYERMGRPQRTANSCKMALQNAGFVNIRPTSFKWPYAPWPKDPKLKTVGQFTLHDFGFGKAFHSRGMALFTRIGGMTTEEAEAICDDAVRAVLNRRIHAYTPYHVVWAQKPFTGR